MPAMGRTGLILLPVPSPGRAQGLAACRGGNEMSGRGGLGYAGLSANTDLLREHDVSSKKGNGLKQRATAWRALGLVSEERPRALSTKSMWQGTHAVPGIGFARLRPARRRPCRQGAKSVAGPGWGQPLHPRPTATGQTSRAERSVCRRNIHLPRSPGDSPALRRPIPLLTGCGFPQAAMRLARSLKT